MPIREFICNECDEHFDEVVFDHWPDPRCPTCNSDDLRQKEISLCNHKIYGYCHKNEY